MSLEQVCKKIKKHKTELSKLGAKNIAIFGSTARENARPDSDIDILVDFDSKKGMFIFIDLKLYLEALLGKKVDLVSRKGLHPALREKILKEAKNAF